MSSTLITHVYVVYVADGLKEIVPVKRVKNFSVKNKEDFKDPGALAYDVEWRDPEDNESYLYDALVHYVGTSEQDVQKQVDEGIANNRRLRKPTAKMLQAALTDSETDEKEPNKQELTKERLAKVTAAKQLNNQQILKQYKVNLLQGREIISPEESVDGMEEGVPQKLTVRPLQEISLNIRKPAATTCGKKKGKESIILDAGDRLQDRENVVPEGTRTFQQQQEILNVERMEAANNGALTLQEIEQNASVVEQFTEHMGKSAPNEDRSKL